jgi:hypothetical protein
MSGAGLEANVVVVDEAGRRSVYRPPVRVRDVKEELKCRFVTVGGRRTDRPGRAQPAGAGVAERQRQRQ